MPKFFVEDNQIDGNQIVLTDTSAFHISHSLRMKTGEKLVIGGPNGYDYYCEIIGFTENTVTLNILEQKKNESENQPKIDLYMCLTKGDKFELVIQKAVELGVSRIIPVYSSRCIAKPVKEREASKTARYNKIAEEAAKQSRRGIIPEISQTLIYNEALNSIENPNNTFICYENEDNYSLKDFIRDGHFNNDSTISFFVGPEGGFSLEEVEKANNMGIRSVSLGKKILRAETAPLFVLSGIVYEFGL